MFDVVLKTAIGNLGLQFSEDKLSRLHYLEQSIVPLPFAKYSNNVRKIASRIEAYFHEPACLKDLEVSLIGTPFQKKVWRALREIPLGQTLTYGDLAKRLKTSARAVGMGCRSNPIALVVPCHRIVAANNVGGFCGQTQGSKITIKEWLLAHESPASGKA